MTKERKTYIAFEILCNKLAQVQEIPWIYDYHMKDIKNLQTIIECFVQDKIPLEVGFANVKTFRKIVLNKIKERAILQY